MKEASYNATLMSKLEQDYGGRAIKIADRATLGLPDSLFSRDLIVSFIECKVGKPSSIVKNGDVYFCRLWDCINDRRQYEFCKLLSKCATVIYCIYWPHIRMSAVITLETLEIFKDSTLLLKQGKHFVDGHGVEIVIRILESKRRSIYGKLRHEFGTST